MTDIAADTLKQIRTAEVLAWSRERKTVYLATNGWRKVSKNRWEHRRSGVSASLAHAALLQAMADLEES